MYHIVRHAKEEWRIWQYSCQWSIRWRFLLLSFSWRRKREIWHCEKCESVKRKVIHSLFKLDIARRAYIVAGEFADVCTHEWWCQSRNIYYGPPCTFVKHFNMAPKDYQLGLKREPEAGGYRR